MTTPPTDWSGLNKSSAVPESAIPEIAKRGLAVSLLQLARPRQWVKNGFVLGPLIFSRSFVAVPLADKALLACAAFCLASSAGYIVNDINDREADRRHPVKRTQRPIASGEVSVLQALMLLGGILTVLALLIALLPALIPALAGYLVLTFTYSIALKRIPVLDIFAISLGFVLRALAGANAIGVPLSFWMSITTLCLALYLAAIKRRQELLHSGSNARGVLKQYTPELLENYAQTAAVTSVVFYGLYVTTVTSALAYTLPFVLMGLFRYQFLAEMKGRGESPGDVLLSDPVLLGIVAAWGALCIFLLR